ncbi:hypothetical protein JZ751_013181 [Albula glossodonta]|uniref:Uncharacterized protein n=1 Tax=Albula glossodonta TaxID=121402 RepID=A0A8T2NWX9_9TELE|nr:hypothetical protein JZ751_013181 [Albula glossodonta]
MRSGGEPKGVEAEMDWPQRVVSGMWQLLVGALVALVAVAVVCLIQFYSTRKAIFSLESVRPPGPLVTDRKQRDKVLKQGK